MLKADLHIHSTVSDGSDSIKEIIENAKKARLDVIAITDHDTLAHQKIIPSKVDGLRVLAGIEISAIDPSTMVKAHILGYGIQDVELVESLTHPLLQRRHENSLKQISILKKNGFHLDEEKLNRADGQYIYKQHIMEYLLQTNQVSEMFGDFYKTIFKNGGICDFDIEYIDVFQAVKAIQNAGGKAVLAHSGQQQNFYLIDKLVPLGLQGLEYNHSANSSYDKLLLKGYGVKYGLFLTGGSDYHGRNEAIANKLGSFLSEESGVEELC